MSDDREAFWKRWSAWRHGEPGQGNFADVQRVLGTYEIFAAFAARHLDRERSLRTRGGRTRPLLANATGPNARGPNARGPNARGPNAITKSDGEETGTHLSSLLRAATVSAPRGLRRR